MLKKVKELLTNTGPQIRQNNTINFKIFQNNLKHLSYKSFGNINRDKVFYVIRRCPTAGLFSNITFILNHLRICDQMNFIPIVDMRYYPTLYNEPNLIKKTKNAWEYFFKKLNNYSLKKVYQSKNVFLSSLRFEKNMALDMTDNSLSKYFNEIKVRKDIIKKKNIFLKKEFDKKNKVLGVHFRGSTYKTARGHALPPTIKLMIKNIEKLMQKYKYDKIFLVTEEQKFLDALKKKFNSKLIYYNSFRMNKLDSFKIYPRRNHRYLLGEEILIETLILSKCQGLTYIKSNVISAAILFAQKKIKTHEIFLGFNTRNKFFSRYLWFIKSFLPPKLGGIKFLNKK